MIIIKNKAINYKYEKIYSNEAGIILSGQEVKIIRRKKIDLTNSFVKIIKNIPYIFNLFGSNTKNILLLHKHEIKKLYFKVKMSRLSIVPAAVYFKGNFIKIEIFLVKGKKIYEKKRTIIEKEMKKRNRNELF